MVYSEEQIREIFFDEMAEIFENIDSCILSLEKSPDNIEVIKNLFRQVHTLKGSSGVFGLKEISDFTHHVEDFLDKMREGKIVPSENIFSVLLKCFDRIKLMIESAKKNTSLSGFNNDDVLHALSEINVSQGEKPKNADNAPTHLASEKQGETKYLVTLSATDQFFLSGIDPLSILLNCRDLSLGIFTVETLTNRVPVLGELNPEVCYLDFKITFTTDADEKTVNEIFQFANLSGKVNIVKLKNTENTNKVTASTENSDFVRLKKEKLDQLMNLVGELITVKNVFLHLGNKLEETLPESEIAKNYREGSAQITRISTRLQESIMNARLVPVGSVFTKYTRLVRDLSKKLGKKVELLIEGEDTELDKTVSEAMSDPIMHLIRNSIDHGIEEPQVRRGRGKSEVGQLLLRASYEGNNVKIIVKDDGNGIEVEKIKARAIERNLVTAEQAEHLSRKELIDFIFHSGFSTATQVTDVSGRGVGMDVVKNNIRKSSGSILIETQEGLGTEFIILLPLSLAVIDALLIGCSGETYALPQEFIIETLRVEPKEILFLNNHASINLRDEIIPLLNLSEIVTLGPSILDESIQRQREFSEINAAGKKYDNTSKPIVILQLETLKIGLLVDNLFGQEQIMIKPLGGFLTNIPIFGGACIMGDGNVVLVLQPQGIYLAGKQNELSSRG